MRMSAQAGTGHRTSIYYFLCPPSPPSPSLQPALSNTASDGLHDRAIIGALVTVTNDEVAETALPLPAAVGRAGAAVDGTADEAADEPGGARVDDVARRVAGVLVQSQAEPAVATPAKGAGSVPRVKVVASLFATPMMEEAAHTDSPGSVTLCSQAHVGRPVISYGLQK